MTVNTQKLVRVIAGPTGPTGTFQGVRIFANASGPTGLFPQWGQINPQQMATGTTGPVGGRYETVYPVGATAYAEAPTGTFKTVCIPGYTGPA
jgi:hypothetical protein